jgi:hypothetical protein
VSQLSGNFYCSRSRIGRLVRTATGFALIATLAATPLAQAQTPLTPATCTDEAREGLRRVGGWAEAQCASDDPTGVAQARSTRCTDDVRAGLRRVGGWAEVQCAVGNQSASTTGRT